MKHDAIISIDPDTKKSGVAFLEVATKRLEVTNLSFPELIDYLKFAKAKSVKAKQKLIVIIEAGWKVAKSNFHGQKGARAQKIAKNVGANHETGRKIVEMCSHLGIEIIEQHPLKKIWKGANRKITQEELQKITGLTGRTNQDASTNLKKIKQFRNIFRIFVNYENAK